MVKAGEVNSPELEDAQPQISIAVDGAGASLCGMWSRHKRVRPLHPGQPQPAGQGASLQQCFLHADVQSNLRTVNQKLQRERPATDFVASGLLGTVGRYLRARTGEYLLRLDCLVRRAAGRRSRSRSAPHESRREPPSDGRHKAIPATMGTEALAPPGLSTRCRIAGGTAMRGARELRQSDGTRWDAKGSSAPVLHAAELFGAFASWVTEGHEGCRPR